MTQPKTIYDKIWESHLVHQGKESSLIYIDRHLVHEVTSPQAFEGLRLSDRFVRQPKKTLAVADHNVPTEDRSKGIKEEESRIQVEALRQNCEDFGIEFIGMDDLRQGIVHIIGPEQGFTLPGSTIVCGDSHTSTHGAFGSLAVGIGTSEVEHVLATQTLIQKKSKNFNVQIVGRCPKYITAKDLALSVIGAVGTAGGTGFVIEYSGNVVESLTMEGRMALCNLCIEAGARAGLIAPDNKTYEYLQNRPMTPKGEVWESALKYWKTLPSDNDVHYDKTITIDTKNLAPLLSLPVGIFRETKKEVKLRRGSIDLSEEVARRLYFIEHSGEDVLTNEALKLKLSDRFGILPDYDSELSPEEYFSLVDHDIISQNTGWKIHRYISLSKLDFSKSVIYQDLDISKWNSGDLEGHDLIMQLFCLHSYRHT